MSYYKRSAMDKIYDSIFRSMSEKNPKLLIPIINEFFGEKYELNQKTELLHGEHHIALEDYAEEITDSCIRINNKLYHIECQSNPDGSMVVRMIEYDFYIALEHVEIEDGEHEIKFPQSAVLYLRYNSNTKDSLKMNISFPDGQRVVYEVPVIKLGNYSRDDILDKKLYFFIPYYLMKYENMKDEEIRSQMKEEYSILYKGMQDALKKGEIDAYDMTNIVTFTNRLLEYLYPNNETSKEVEEMGGQLIRTYGDEMIEKGIEQGIEKGIEVYILDKLEDGVDENIIISRLMKNFSLTEEKAKMYFEKYAYQNI